MMNSPNGPSTDDLRNQIAALRADFAKLSDAAAESAKEGVSAAGRSVAKTGREAREGVVDAVTSHPHAAIGIAAGVGYLLGVLTRG
jgi:ElaB/YqjD/DUF883 family membrane-anchored ribosome-binding protein